VEPRKEERSGIVDSFTFHGFGHLVCSDSELTAEIMDPFTYFERTLWTGDHPITKPRT
jgi:hypothetical protein